MALTAAVTQAGTVLTLTITTAPGDRDQYETLPGTVTVDPDGAGPFAPATVNYESKRKLAAPAPLVVTDPARTWTKVDDNGTVAHYTSPA